jgi:hypothetical protein
MSKKSNRRKAKKTASARANGRTCYRQESMVAAEQVLDEFLREIHTINLPTILEHLEQKPRLGVDNEEMLRAFERYLVSSYEYVDAFTKNGIYPTLIELNPIDGSKQALATIGYCAPCPDSDEHESGEIWKIRIPLPQFTSEAEFEGILKAHIAQMGALSKTLQTLGELLSALPGNKPVLDCFLSAHGYVQDVNGYVLSGSAISASPGVYDGVVRFPGPVSQYTLEELVERWKTEYVARQEREVSALVQTVQGVFKNFEFDSVEATKETNWDGTAVADGEKIPVALQFKESGFRAVFNWHVPLASLVGDRLNSFPKEVVVECEWIEAPEELLEAVKKKCPDIAASIPQFFKLPDGRVAEISMERCAA